MQHNELNLFLLLVIIAKVIITNLSFGEHTIIQNFKFTKAEDCLAFNRKLNLNKLDLADLLLIPGIGDKIGQKIIQQKKQFIENNSNNKLTTVPYKTMKQYLYWEKTDSYC